jgi:hypothetical protein
MRIMSSTLTKGTRLRGPGIDFNLLSSGAEAVLKSS